VAANPQTKPTDLGCEYAERLAAIPSADIIAIYYHNGYGMAYITG